MVNLLEDTPMACEKLVVFRPSFEGSGLLPERPNVDDMFGAVYQQFSMETTVKRWLSNDFSKTFVRAREHTTRSFYAHFIDFLTRLMSCFLHRDSEQIVSNDQHP